MANIAEYSTTTWKVSVQTTAFIPPYGTKHNQFLRRYVYRTDHKTIISQGTYDGSVEYTDQVHYRYYEDNVQASN